MPVDLLAGTDQPAGDNTTVQAADSGTGPVDLFAQHPEWAPKDLLAEPVDQTPWYQKQVDLPSWIDKDKWNAAVTTLEDNFRQTGAKAGKLATNPLAIAEGVTEIAQQIPGFLGGMAGAVGRLAVEIGKGEYNLNHLYNSAAETFQEASKGINKAVRVYTPQYPEEAAFLGEVAMAPAEAAMMAGHEIADSEAVNALPEGVRDQVKGLFKFAGDIGGLVLQGKAAHVAKGLRATPEAAPVDTGPLDTTFAKDQILQRIAKERASTPQRPLERLAKAEGDVPVGKYEQRQADLEAAFSGDAGKTGEPTNLGPIPSPEQARQMGMALDQPIPLNQGEPIRTGAWEETGGPIDASTIRSPETQIRQPESSQDIYRQGQNSQGEIPEGTPVAQRQVGEERRTLVPGPGGETGYVERRVSNHRLPTDRRTADIPQLRNTEEAVDFGEQATPAQINRMQLMLEDSRAKSAQMREQAKSIQDPVARMQMMQAGMDEAFRGQLLRESIDASRGENPTQVKMRKLADIARDVNTALGKKGSVGDVGGMSPDQLAAYDRLTKDYLVLRRNAKRVGKTVEDYLKGLRVDPVVAAAMQRNADALLAHASAMYGANILKRYEDAADQKPREGKYAGSVNLDKQDISAAGKQLEMALAADQPKRTITWEETGAKAAKAMLNPKSAEAAFNRLQRLSQGKLTQDVEVVRQINSATQQLFGDLFDQFKTGEITQEEFNAGMANYNEQVFRRTSDMSSELGRALNILRKTAIGDRIPQLMAKYDKLNDRQKAMVDAVTRKWREGTLTKEDIGQFEKMMPDPKWSDYLKQIWYNNVLSGPVTHMKNLSSNTTWVLAQPALRGLSGALDAPLSKLRGVPRTRYMSEVWPMLTGYKRGFSTGALRARDMFRHGYLPAIDTKWDMEMGTAATAFERSPYPLLRKMAPAFTQFTRALHAMDVWAKAVAADGELSALARRASASKGLKGAERIKFEQDYMDNPPESALKATRVFADDTTFMGTPDPLTSGIITLRNIPVFGTAMRLTVLPFVNTIAKLQKLGLELTPGVGLAREVASYRINKAMKAMPEGRVKAMGAQWLETREYNPSDIMAKQILGTTLSLYMLYKASQGRITGPLPEDPAERDFWYRNNIQPWSIRFGGTDAPNGLQDVRDGTWHTYRWAEPFNTPMAASALFYDRVLKGKAGPKDIESWFDMAGGMWKNLLDGAYFSGLQSMLDTSTPFGKRVERGVPRFLTGWVPASGFMRTAARTYEVLTQGHVTVKDPEHYWLAPMSQVIPGLVDMVDVPSKLTIYGEDAVVPGGILQQWLPFKWAKSEPDAVEQTLMQVGLYPSLPNHTVRFVGKTYNIPEDAYRDFAMDFGSQLKSSFAKLVDNPRFPQLTQEQKFEKLNQRLSAVRDMARRRLRVYMYQHKMFVPENEINAKP
jgi:hypothetical protein